MRGVAERPGCGLGSLSKVRGVNHSHSSSVCLSQQGLAASSDYENLEGYEASWLALILLSRDGQTSVKSQMVNPFGFVGLVTTVPVFHLCSYYSLRVARDSM